MTNINPSDAKNIHQEWKDIHHAWRPDQPKKEPTNVRVSVMLNDKSIVIDNPTANVSFPAPDQSSKRIGDTIAAFAKKIIGMIRTAFQNIRNKVSSEKIKGNSEFPTSLIHLKDQFEKYEKNRTTWKLEEKKAYVKMLHDSLVAELDNSSPENDKIGKEIYRMKFQLIDAFKDVGLNHPQAIDPTQDEFFKYGLIR